MTYSVTDIVERLGGEIRGDGKVLINQVAPLERAARGDISFVVHPKFRKLLEATEASAVIVPQSLADAFAGTRIIVSNPHLYFAKVAQLLNPVEQVCGGIHPSAVVLSKIPESVSVAPLSYIGERCTIGENSVIGAGCVIGDGVTLGESALLHGNVTVYSGSEIGDRVVLHSGCVIGADGFGFARHADGRWEKIPQIGRTILGHDVEIGANTTVDRGAMDDTVIENGTKIDNLTQIGHNCRVGENAIISSLAGMGGSSTLGKRVMLGGQSGIMGHIQVGDDIAVSPRSFVSKTVMEKNVYSSLIFAQPHQEWLRNSVHLRHLDKLVERVSALEKQLKERENKA